MRALSSALDAAFGYPVQAPAWFIQVDYAAGTERYSSLKTTTWKSQSWTQRDVDVSSIRVGALEISGALVLGNADGVMGAYALASYFGDRRIRIWGYDGSMAAPADTDPLMLCDGVGAGASVAADYVRVGIRDFVEHAIGPRQVVSPTFGFYTYLPAGKTLRINNVDYVIEG